MSQSRFSIVLVGVSALLRRPLVSRLRPAEGERSSWVVFTARGGRFDSGFRSAGWPSGSLLRRLPLGELAFGFTASAFRHAPLRGCPRRVGSSAFRFGVCHSAGWPSGSRLPLFGTHRFGVALGELVLPPSVSELPFGGLAFGLTASVFRHAPFRSCRSASWPSGSPLPLFGTHRFGVAAGRVRSSAFRFGVAVRRVGLRAHCFRFSACAASEWPLGEFVLPPSVSEITAGRVGLRVHRFRFSACTASGLPSAG